MPKGAAKPALLVRTMPWPVRLYRWAAPARRNLTWLPNIAATTLASAASVVLVFAPAPDGSFRAGFVWTAVGLIALGLLISGTVEILRLRRARREHEERLQFQETMNDAVLPIIGRLAETVSSTAAEREEARVQLVGNASTAMRMLLQDRPRARVIVYRVGSRQGQRRRLEAVNFIGRKDKPGSFVDGTKRGSPVFRWLVGDEPTVFVDDVIAHPPAGWEDKGHDYRTFIAARISAGSEGYGMLCIDSPEVGDLDNTDVVLVDLVASLLGIAFAQADRKP